MNGRRAKNDAAHPMAAAAWLVASLTFTATSLGFAVADGKSVRTVLLGVLAVLCAVAMAWCLRSPKAPAEDDWRGFGYASVGDLEDAERRAAEYEQDWRKHAQHLAEQDVAERGDSR